jgi:hypothetical protein
MKAVPVEQRSGDSSIGREGSLQIFRNRKIAPRRTKKVKRKWNISDAEPGNPMILVFTLSFPCPLPSAHEAQLG